MGSRRVRQQILLYLCTAAAVNLLGCGDEDIPNLPPRPTQDAGPDGSVGVGGETGGAGDAGIAPGEDAGAAGVGGDAAGQSPTPCELVDQDGDGFFTARPAGCLLPDPNQPLDCNDADPLVRPADPNRADPAFLNATLCEAGASLGAPAYTDTSGWSPHCSDDPGMRDPSAPVPPDWCAVAIGRQPVKGECESGYVDLTLDFSQVFTVRFMNESPTRWFVLRSVGNYDLSDKDLLVLPFRGDPSLSQHVQSSSSLELLLELKLEGKTRTGGSSCLRQLSLPHVSLLPMERHIVVPIEAFLTRPSSNDGSTCEIDPRRISAIELGIKARSASPEPLIALPPASVRLGQLRAVSARELHGAANMAGSWATPTYFECTPPVPELLREAAMALLIEHDRCRSGRGAPCPAWLYRRDPMLETRALALELMVFTREFATGGDERFQRAAEYLADQLVMRQQSDGWWQTKYHWPDWGESGDYHVGDLAWTTVALSDFLKQLEARSRFSRDLAQRVRQAVRKARDALGRRANEIQKGIADRTFTEVPSTVAIVFFALHAAGSSTKADELGHALLCKGGIEQRGIFRHSSETPLLFDETGGLAVAFLRAVGRPNLALELLGAAPRLFLARSFNEPRVLGMSAEAGIGTPSSAATAIYLGSGGWGSRSLLPELRKLGLGGLYQGAADTFAGGGPSGTTAFGIEPTASVYLGLSGLLQVLPGADKLPDCL